jgi:phosphopantothenate---cysteine ligase (CTP)
MPGPINVLLTSGGTRIPIDRVRHIANMSRGTFGSQIAVAGLRDCGWNVTFLAAEGSRTPFRLELDCARTTAEAARAQLEEHLALRELLPRYREIVYKDFDSYAARLDECLAEGPDVVVLAAAVSDYGTVPAHGKIRSGPDLTIELHPLPKLISAVRDKAKAATLVGFKLLVDSSDDDLVQAAYKSVVGNRCDLVVANDLRDIQAAAHRVLLVRDRGGTPDVEPLQGPGLATAVAEHITRTHLAKLAGGTISRRA